MRPAVARAIEPEPVPESETKNEIEPENETEIEIETELTHFIAGSGIKVLAPFRAHSAPTADCVLLVRQGQGGSFFYRACLVYQDDINERGFNTANPDILNTPIGQVMDELAKKTGAYTHSPHSVAQPMTSPVKRAKVILDALVRLLLYLAAMADVVSGGRVVKALGE